MIGQALEEAADNDNDDSDNNDSEEVEAMHLTSSENEKTHDWHSTMSTPAHPRLRMPE